MKVRSAGAQKRLGPRERNEKGGEGGKRATPLLVVLLLENGQSRAQSGFEKRLPGHIGVQNAPKRGQALSLSSVRTRKEKGKAGAKRKALRWWRKEGQRRS